MTEPEFVDFSEEGLPTVADLKAWEAMKAAQNGGNPEPEREDTWQPQNLAELADQPPVQPTLGGVGIVYPGKRHVFSGPQESAKTLAAYAIGLEVIRAGQKVVLIDFEMGPWDTRRRLLELGATMPELANIAYIEPSERAEGTVIERLVQLNPGLVIIDAAAGAFELQTLDDNKRQDVERFASTFVQPFWRAGIATIVLDHVVKNAEARGNYAIGSERKVGGADVHLGFTVVNPIKRGGTGLYKITTHKDRGGFLRRGKLAEFALTSDPDTHRIRWELRATNETDEDHPFRPTVLMERVSRYLERQREPVPMKQLEEDVEGKRDGLRLAVEVLRDEGFVKEQEGPRKARLLTSELAYREDDDHSKDLAPQTSPHLAPDSHLATSPLAPSAFRRGEDEGGDVTSPLTSPPTDDDIPF